MRDFGRWMCHQPLFFWMLVNDQICTKGRVVVVRCQPAAPSTFNATQFVVEITSSIFFHLMPHFLGYIPYGTAYGIILQSFHYNTTLLPSTAQGPPDWVQGIIWGQFFLFSAFILPQLAQQCNDMGCERYIVWEAVYILLSLVAKMVLGLMLVVNVFVYSSFDEAVAAS